MKKNNIIKNIILIIFLAILIFLIKSDIDIKTIDENEIKNTKQRKDTLINSVRVDNIDCIYNNDTGIWFFPKKISDLEKNIDANITIQNSKSKNMNYIILQNNEKVINNKIKLDFENCLNIIAYDSKYYSEIKLQFSGLPLIEIRSDNSEFDTNDTTVLLRIIDPYYNERKNKSKQYTETLSKIHVRGKYTQFLPKKQYKISLLKDNFTKNNETLLGIRKDDDWVLDALYPDPSNIRNKLSCDLWNQINSYNTTGEYDYDLNCEFVEVFINNRYAGIYVLKDKVDAKKMEMNKSEEGIIIKGYDHIFTYDENGDRKSRFENSYETYKKIFSQEYPKNKNKMDIINSKITNFFASPDNPDDDYIEENFDIYNLIDYNILVNASRAIDNIDSKNIYLVMKNDNSKINIIPWDLDLSWGLDYSEEKINPITNTYFYFDYDRYNLYCTMYYKNNAQKYNQLVKQRYNQLRENILSYENIEKLCNEYKDEIIKSGAYSRDNKLYYSYNIEKEINDILQWYKKRIEFLDNCKID